jgi:hypothetical protein
MTGRVASPGEDYDDQIPGPMPWDVRFRKWPNGCLSRFPLLLSGAVFHEVFLLKDLDGVEEIQVVLLYVRLSLLIVPVEFHQAQRAARPVEYRKLSESAKCMHVGIYKPFP